MTPNFKLFLWMLAGGLLAAYPIIPLGRFLTILAFLLGAAAGGWIGLMWLIWRSVVAARRSSEAENKLA